MAASIAALSSPEAWEAARQTAHEQVQAFDLGAVCRGLAPADPRRVPGGDGTGARSCRERQGDRAGADRAEGMFFTLAVSAATAGGCAALTDRALAVDPAVMPIPGPAVVAWRSPDGRAALLHWGRTRRGEPGGSGGADRRADRARAVARRRRAPLARGHDLGGDADAGRRPCAGVRAHLGHPRRPGLPGRGSRRGHRRRPGDVGRVDVLAPGRP